MRTYKGNSVCGGYTEAPVYIYKRTVGIPPIRKITDTESEKSRFFLARHIAVKELAVLYEKALAILDESAAMIFEIHQLMLSDSTLTDAVCEVIDSKKINAEAAVAETCASLIKLFNGMEDGYISARRADISDVCERVIAILQSSSQPYPEPFEPSIIISDDLSPSEILLPERNLIKGVVMINGSATSHASILARKMNIPCICAVKDVSTDIIIDISKATLDADNGILTLE